MYLCYICNALQIVDYIDVEHLDEGAVSRRSYEGSLKNSFFMDPGLMAVDLLELYLFSVFMARHFSVSP
jgi:hypothetical protein